MDRISLLDPPGTINPAKLLPGAVAIPSASEILDASKRPAFPASCPDDAMLQMPPATPMSFKPLQMRSPLPRISSDWDPQHDIVVDWRSKYQDVREEYEATHFETRRPAPGKTKHISHHGFFRTQSEGSVKAKIPADPGGSYGATVVTEKSAFSIYDTYLLKANIAKNINVFRRHQVLFNPAIQTYSLVTREGRVGYHGQVKQEVESTDLRHVTNKFRKVFREKTGLNWSRRYDPPIAYEDRFLFVELDYCRGDAVDTPVKLPNHSLINLNIKEEVRGLMEIILYGGSTRQGKDLDDPDSSSSWFGFGAPYQNLSRWTIFSAVKTLWRIWKYLESGRIIQWKTILRASSRYRSQIPFCAAHSRPPVISSYHALFVELKFLHSLWPRKETADMLKDIHLRGYMQLNVCKSLAQPLYQAYSSMRHGFRRLTDAASFEFREVRKYLEDSCCPMHHMKLELQDIYQVFVKNSLSDPYRDWIASDKSDNSCSEERLLLWHGTPLDSLLGILDLGLQIRRRGASLTGAMFGNGIYLADVSSKSAGYCRHRLWKGDAVLLLCEADVGSHRIRSPNSIYNAHDIIKNSSGQLRCVEGLGRVGPARWTKAGWDIGGLPQVAGENIWIPDTTVPYNLIDLGRTLAYNEYVVYDPSHVTIRYLVRLKINGGRY